MDSVDDTIEDWERDLAGSDSYPMLAIGVGVAVIAIIAIILFFAAPVDVSRNLVVSYGVAAVIALAVWGGAWWLTLRRAGNIWMAAALAILLATAGGATMVLADEATAMVRLDVTSMQRIRVNLVGDPVIIAADPYKGPLTKLAMAYIKDVLAERKRRDAAVKKLTGEDRQPDDIVTAADCSNFDRAKAEMAQSDARVAGFAAKLRQGINDGIGNARLRAEALGLFDSGYGKAHGEIVEMSRLRAVELDQVKALCGIIVGHGGHRIDVFGSTLTSAERQQIPRLFEAMRDARNKQNELRTNTINRINAKLELGGDTRF